MLFTICRARFILLGTLEPCQPHRLLHHGRQTGPVRDPQVEHRACPHAGVAIASQRSVQWAEIGTVGNRGGRPRALIVKRSVITCKSTFHSSHCDISPNSGFFTWLTPQQTPTKNFLLLLLHHKIFYSLSSKKIIQPFYGLFFGSFTEPFFGPFLGHFLSGYFKDSLVIVEGLGFKDVATRPARRRAEGSLAGRANQMGGNRRKMRDLVGLGLKK